MAQQVLIVGASRGIGREFARQYLADGARVTASARDDASLAALRDAGAQAVALDVTDAQSVAKLAWTLDGAAFDIVVINAGVYGPHSSGLEPPPQEDFDTVMRTNVLGPMRIVSQLADLLAPGAKVAMLSSRMGSIGTRSGTSGWLYRASKAALNSVMKDSALVYAGRAVCISFHPGWVRTDMGGAGADLAPEQSVSSMRRVIAGLKAEDNGRFYDHDGTPIAF